MKSQLWGEQFLNLNRCMSVSLLQQCTWNHLRPSRRHPQWSRSAHQQGNTHSDTKSIYIFAVFISCSVLEDSVCRCKKNNRLFPKCIFFNLMFMKFVLQTGSWRFSFQPEAFLTSLLLGRTDPIYWTVSGANSDLTKRIGLDMVEDDVYVQQAPLIVQKWYEVIKKSWNLTFLEKESSGIGSFTVLPYYLSLRYLNQKTVGWNYSSCLVSN